MELTSLVFAASETVANASADLIPGKVIIGLFSAIFAAGGGIWIGNARGRKAGEAEAERRHVDGTVNANLPQPMSIEQSAYQVNWKANDKDHENLFGRVGRLEQSIARVEAKSDATFEFIQKQLDSLTSMTSQLFDRIIKGKKN